MATIRELQFAEADIVDGPNKTVLAIRLFNLDDGEDNPRWQRQMGGVVLFRIDHPVWTIAEVRVQQWTVTFSLDELEFEGPLSLSDRDKTIGTDRRAKGTYNTRTRKGHVEVMK